MIFYPHCVQWGVVQCSWVRFQSFDDVGPDLHRVEVFDFPPLDHCHVLVTILMCPDCWGHLVYQVYSAADVQYIASFPVEPDNPLPQDVCSFILPFGGCVLLT